MLRQNIYGGFLRNEAYQTIKRRHKFGIVCIFCRKIKYCGPENMIRKSPYICNKKE
jgi:hypothetical protein